MKLKDLIRQENSDIKLITFQPGYKEKASPDSLSWREERKAFYLERFKTLKSNPTKEAKEYFNIYSLALQYCGKTVSIIKKLNSPPYLERGVKGFILDNKFLDLVPIKWREKMVNHKNIKDLCWILFDGQIVRLPHEYYKFLKK